MEAFYLFNIIYIMYALPIYLVIFLIFYKLFNLKAWYATDIISFIAPCVIYPTLYAIRLHKVFGNSKSLSNIVELKLIACASGIYFLIRSIVGQSKPNYSITISKLNIFIVSITTIAIYLFTPGLQE